MNTEHPNAHLLSWGLIRRLAPVTLGLLTLSACDGEPQQLNTVEVSAEEAEQYIEQGDQAQAPGPDAGEAEFRRARVAVRSVRSQGYRLPRWFFSQVTPHLNCVDELGNGRFRAHWGYTNHSNYTTRIRRGWWNAVLPFPIKRGQPRRFRPGTHDDVFTTRFRAGQRHSWWLMWNVAYADEDSPRCDQADLCEGVVCDDNNPCTMGQCNAADGSCEYLPAEEGTECQINGESGTCAFGECLPLGCTSDSECGDSNVCNGTETCGVDGVCVPGTNLDCDDSNPCTANECDPTNGCQATNVEDGLECQLNGEAGTCQAGICEELGCQNDADCQDSDACNGEETCGANGECAAGTPLNCDDSNPCTANSCDPASGCESSNVQDGTECQINGEAGQCNAGVCEELGCQSDDECQDGDACNGAEVCNADGSCGAGTALNCDDSNPCTANSCDPENGCITSPLDDGASCQVNGEAGACNAGTCEALGCQNDADCDDGNYCTGTETCNTTDGTCVAGTALNCDDSNPCTANSCDPASGCVSTAVTDGTTCTIDGEAGKCNAGVCEEQGCQSDAECQDGNACNGAEVCNADGTCGAGTALNCDDSNPCTADSCDPSQGCVNAAGNDNLQCTDANNDVGLCQAGSCARLQLYTFGHGDLGFEIDINEGGELEPHIHVGGSPAGVVDGQSIEDQEYSFNEVAIVTNANFTRPSGDGGAFNNLCVGEGETVKWLPQSNSDADALNVPFFGIAAEEIDPGVVVDDQVSLRLVNVQSPNGDGHYMLWNIPTFMPQFPMTSCDGIDANDTMTIPLGHDHFNMGFANGGLGLWRITYEVSATLVSDPQNPRVEQFTVNYLIQ